MYGPCTAHVRDGLQAAGIDTHRHPLEAKDYGPYLEQWGFHAVHGSYVPQIGDIAVIQPTLAGERDGISSSGHIAVYDGHRWVSDFYQIDVWGGKYRKDGLPITFYRHY